MNEEALRNLDHGMLVKMINKYREKEAKKKGMDIVQGTDDFLSTASKDELVRMIIMFRKKDALDKERIGLQAAVSDTGGITVVNVENVGDDVNDNRRHGKHALSVVDVIGLGAKELFDKQMVALGSTDNQLGDFKISKSTAMRKRHSSSQIDKEKGRPVSSSTGGIYKTPSNPLLIVPPSSDDIVQEKKMQRRSSALTMSIPHDDGYSDKAISEAEKTLTSTYLGEPESLVVQQQIATETKSARQFFALMESISELSSICGDLGYKFGIAMKKLKDEVEKAEKFMDTNPSLKQSLKSTTSILGEYSNFSIDTADNLLKYIHQPLHSYCVENSAIHDETVDTWEVSKNALETISIKYFKKVSGKGSNKNIDKEYHDIERAYVDKTFKVYEKLKSFELITKPQFLRSIIGFVSAATADAAIFEDITQTCESFMPVLGMTKNSIGESEKYIENTINTYMFKPPVDNIDGLNMRGYLMYKFSKKSKWTRGYFGIDYGYLIRYDVTESGRVTSKQRFNLLASSLKDLRKEDRPFAFEVITFSVKDGTSESIMLQARTSHDLLCWKNGITNAALDRLSSQNREDAPHDRIAIPADKKSIITSNSPLCVDCDKPNPEWASINMGCMMCINCSGVHRSMGVNFSKIRSLALDKFEPQAIETLLILNNTFLNSILEAQLIPEEKIGPNAEREDRETFIHAKYKDRKYARPASYDHQSYNNILLLAAATGSLQNILTAILYGADLDTVDEYGNTPLIISIINEQYPAAQFLSSNGADLNHYSAERQTPLHLAIEKRQEDLIMGLITKGANPLLEDANGQTCLQQLKEMNFSMIDLVESKVKDRH
eukprot:TRINITY_DN10417_c0_g1_i1.p1 TRINITY_DN10417_c0_g1~~TRINITY_DN10417_c0_g1_i1.p1  ORF type:complete len:834 (-),score=166.80 TRINITY_DN10417_c0_g1_i1:34-2535(-)